MLLSENSDLRVKKYLNVNIVNVNDIFLRKY